MSSRYICTMTNIHIDPLFAGKPVTIRISTRLWGGFNYSVCSAASGSPIEQGWQFTREDAEARCAALKAAYEAPRN